MSSYADYYCSYGGAVIMKKFKPFFISRPQSGFTLIELMVAIAISLFIMIALVAVLVNVSRTNNEIAKTNSLVENGRFAIQLLQDDLVHAGFWDNYVPQFDNFTWPNAPTDLPTAVPDPCAAFATWNAAYKNNLIGIGVQPVPSGNCADIVANQKAHTDAVVVRHAEPCVPGTGNCAASTPGAVYFQSSLCSGASQLGSSTTTIRLAANASAINDAFALRTVRLVSGTGNGQSSIIQTYDGTTKIATVLPIWATTPDTSTNYSLDAADFLLEALSTAPSNMTLTTRNCSTTANLRKFISNIYYIRDFAVTAGDGIPTLMRSQFDLAGGTPAHQNPVPLLEGIEGFRIEYGVDSIGRSGATVTNVEHLQPVIWDSLAAPKWPINRGDGQPDGAFVRCPAANTAAVNTVTVKYPVANACTVTQLTDTVEVKLYVLARSKDATPGHTDSKTYALGSTILGPFNDGFQRHVFSTSVRLTNISSRRETPQ